MAARCPQFPLDFSDSDELRRRMQGAAVHYNTYWARFGTGGTTFDQAVENSRVLFDAAIEAGVGRIVHLSGAYASTESRLPYFRRKGQVEEVLRQMGNTLRHLSAHSCVWGGRPAAEQYGLGAAPVSGIPCCRQRGIPGAVRLRRRSGGLGSGG